VVAHARLHVHEAFIAHSARESQRLSATGAIAANSARHEHHRLLAWENPGFHKGMDDLAQSGRTGGSTEMLRFVLGLEGTFEWVGREVRWDVSYNRGESRSQTDNTQLIEENYREALDLEVSESGEIVCSSGNSACAPLNILGYVTDPDAISFVTQQAYEDAKLVQQVVTANLATDLLELPGGNWQMAAGYAQREEESSYQPDHFLVSGLGRSAPLAPLSGAFDTQEFYLETRLPLIREDFLPVISSFDLEGAFRTIDHSSAGTGDTWNLGVRMAFDVPRFGNITLRGNLTESVRAPAIAEAFLPLSQVFSSAADPCDFRYIDEGEEEGQRAELCAQEAAALGFEGYDPAEFQSIIANATQQGFTGGNPDLRNEVAESESIGLVFELDFIEGLTYSVDYLDIYLGNAIENLSLTEIMKGCYDGGDLSAEACGRFSRDPATFQVIDFRTGVSNAGYRILKGFQQELRYDFDIPQVLPGQFSVRANLWDLHESRVSVTGDDANNTKGFASNASLRGNANLGWTLDRLTLNWKVQYINRAVKSNTAPAGTFDVPELSAHYNHTLFASYAFTEQIEASVAIRNITDEKPPYGMNSLGAIGTYDLLGRYVNMTLNYRF